MAAHANAIKVLDETGNEMISQDHFASDTIKVWYTTWFLHFLALPYVLSGVIRAIPHACSELQLLCSKENRMT